MERRNNVKRTVVLGLVLVLLLTACGGESPDNQATGGEISGEQLAGPVVTVYKPPT
jgi:hypothetical protein